MRIANDLKGVAAMLAATAVFVVGDSFMKVVTEYLPPLEVLFLRGIAASLICAILVGVRGEAHAIRGVFETRTLLRAAGETMGTLCHITALARLPIADVTAILQTAPLLLIIGAAVILRERIGAARAVLVCVGFAGALLVAQPGTGGFSSASLFAFGAALSIAARDLVARGVPATIPVTVVILATMVMVTITAGVGTISLEAWTPPQARHLAFLTVSGLCLALGHAGLVLAYRLCRTATVAPFFYSFALWALVAGFVVWGDLPNAMALAGIALITISGAMIVVHENRRGRMMAPADAL